MTRALTNVSSDKETIHEITRNYTKQVDFVSCGFVDRSLSLLISD